MRIIPKAVMACFVTANCICAYAQADDVFNLLMVTPRGQTPLEIAFVDEFKKLYKKKVNVTYVLPKIGDQKEMADLPNKIRAMKPDLIFTFGTPTTLAVAGTTSKPIITDIPIAFGPVSYPIRTGVVGEGKNLRQNITGTSHLAPISVHFEMMMLFKKFKTIGVAYNKKEQQTAFMIQDLEAAAKRFKVTLLKEEIDSDASGAADPSSIPKKIRNLKERGAEWLYIGPDTFMGFNNKELTTKSSNEIGLPSFTIGEHPIRYANATFGVVARMDELGKYTAFKAFNALVRKDPNFLGAGNTYKYDILINQCSLDAIGITPSSEIAALSDFLTVENNGCKK